MGISYLVKRISQARNARPATKDVPRLPRGTRYEPRDTRNEPRDTNNEERATSHENDSMKTVLAKLKASFERVSVKTRVTLIATLLFLLSLLLVSAIQLYYVKADMKAVLTEQQRTFLARIADELDQKLKVHLDFVEA